MKKYHPHLILLPFALLAIYQTCTPMPDTFTELLNDWEELFYLRETGTITENEFYHRAETLYQRHEKLFQKSEQQRKSRRRGFQPRNPLPWGEGLSLAFFFSTL